MSGVIVFLISWLVFWGAIVYIVIFSQKFIKKKKKEEDWQRNKKIYFSVIGFTWAIGLAILIFTAGPMTIDIPQVIAGNYQKVEGYITDSNVTKKQGITPQHLTIDDNEKFSVYFQPTFQEGEYVQVLYLPTSRFVVEVKESRAAQ